MPVTLLTSDDLHRLFYIESPCATHLYWKIDFEGHKAGERIATDQADDAVWVQIGMGLKIDACDIIRVLKDGEAPDAR